MSSDISGKAVIVTGGASGIGRATALRFAEGGARVVIADINATGGEETVRLIRAAHGDASALFVQTDVSQAAQVEALVAAAAGAYGRLDCAFNNAGVSTRGALHELSEEAWERVISIDLKGVWLCMKYEIAQMLRQGGGAIVNTASVLGLVGGDWQNSPYIAAKHGVIGLTRAAALEYGKQGIRVNAVCPGTIDTPLLAPGNAERFLKYHPIGRIGQPDEVAQAVVWLCSSAASFVTGHAMAVDGGWLAQ
ncbi:MAG: SDR family oxidoreductase [Chloroflexi bacterium]|nr:SDR family oxidoreductase [Chloroflexota bacterium]MCL5273395.1 SDR family oxidoreductase [Chloroflexota bacterium]